MRGMTGGKTRRLLGAILAGGRASRYGGRPKGLLEIAPGLSIIENEVRQLRRAGLSEVVLVAGEKQPYSHLGLEVIPDLRADCGPLGGIEAALAWARGRFEATLFLPCDLPGITAKEIRRLRRAFGTGGVRVAVCTVGACGFEPLCTVVHNDLLPQITLALDRGERSPGRLWRALGALEVPCPDPAAFHNVNEPADLAAWLVGRKSLGTGCAECAPRDA